MKKYLQSLNLILDMEIGNQMTREEFAPKKGESLDNFMERVKKEIKKHIIPH